MKVGPKENIVGTLYRAVQNQEIWAIQAWREQYSDAVLIAHDYPAEGKQRLVRPTDLRLYFGSDSIQVGFDTEEDAQSPMTIMDIGRLSVVNFIECNQDFRL